MKLSPNVAGLNESGTFALFDRIAQLRARGEDIVSLAIGEPHTDTPDVARSAGIRAIVDGKTRYTANSGIIELRTALKERLGRLYDWHPATDQILVSNGTKQALYCVLTSLCGPGDEVLVIQPYYPSYLSMIRLAGAEPVFASTRAENGFQIERRTLDEALTSRTRGIILNSPNNPTGAVYTSGSLKAVAEFVRTNDLWLISDEIYEHLVYPPAAHLSPVGHDPVLRDRAVLIAGFSKGFAMTGWRVGCAVGPIELIRAAGLVQMHSTGNVCSISQHAALGALEAETTYSLYLREQYRTRRDELLGVLATVPGLATPPADGAFYLFPSVAKFFGATARDRVIRRPSDLALFLLEEVGLAVVPGEVFGDDHAVRISYATDEASLREGCRRLRRGFELLT